MAGLFAASAAVLPPEPRMLKLLLFVMRSAGIVPPVNDTRWGESGRDHGDDMFLAGRTAQD